MEAPAEGDLEVVLNANSLRDGRLQVCPMAGATCKMGKPGKKFCDTYRTVIREVSPAHHSERVVIL